MHLYLPGTPIPDPFDTEEVGKRRKDLQWIEERLIDVIAVGVAKGIAKAFGK
ncbi:hypothetical protein QMM44_01545 [Leptospira santarosai]|uniref:hypothetical protein n=1 Tax=Leptospira santarosai TaxID=28183 RepID=UPI000B16B389|nr:hypothetical protein [Leptospira santarosai]MDI7196292.1 hypothetical protein [Leptospira santarosai]MDI7202135.1 hypothetical protein [Leptospira santarosai]